MHSIPVWCPPCLFLGPEGCALLKREQHAANRGAKRRGNTSRRARRHKVAFLLITAQVEEIMEI